MRREARSFAHLGLARDWTFGVREGDRTRMIPGGVATPGLFEAFGARPALGRLFEPRDLQSGGVPVVIVGHEFWQSRFGGRADILDEARPVGNLVLPPVGKAFFYLVRNTLVGNYGKSSNGSLRIIALCP